MRLMNDADSVYTGETAIGNGVRFYQHNHEYDNYLADLWGSVFDEDTDMFIIHDANDPQGRSWTYISDTLRVTRIREPREDKDDLTFHGVMGTREGMHAFIQGHGGDPLLEVLYKANIRHEDDVFTIHYDHGRLQPRWSLETRTHVITGKALPYPEAT
jgi:hypothetical protein